MMDTNRLLQLLQVKASLSEFEFPVGAREWLVEEILKCVGWPSKEEA